MQESVINSSTLSRISYSNNEIIRIRNTYKMESENTKQRVIQGKSEIQPNRNKRFNEYSTKQVLGEIKRFYIEKEVVNGCQRVNIFNELNGKMLKVDYNKFMDDFRKAIERRNEELAKKHISILTYNLLKASLILICLVY